jgi:hypothetical protein
MEVIKGRLVADREQRLANLYLLVATEQGISICQKSQNRNVSLGIHTLVQLCFLDCNKNRSSQFFSNTFGQSVKKIENHIISI